MDEKTIETVWKSISERIDAVIRDEFQFLMNRSNQKNKKTEKPVSPYDCRLKQLYATRKYGCSGFEASAICLKCEFRR